MSVLCSALEAGGAMHQQISKVYAIIRGDAQAEASGLKTLQ